MPPYRDNGKGLSDAMLAIEAPIRDVTVLEDRAVITRRARFELPVGTARLFVDGVSPVIVDKSLTAELCGGKARVADVRVVRTYVHEDSDSPADIRGLDEDVSVAKQKLDVIVESRLAIALEAGGLTQTLPLFLAELAEDAAWGRDATERERELGDIIERERALSRELARTGLEEAHARRAHDRALERRASGEKPTGKQRACLELQVAVDEAATYELTLRYVVANACWRPRHRVTLHDATSTATVEARGTVWQNTGEAWTDARLTFSTERPSLGTRPPTLETEWLSVTRKGALVIETREEKVVELAEGSAAQQLVDEMPGIDDGGVVARLVAAHPMTIASDGRPHSTTLFSAESPAEIELVATPELCLAAITRVTLFNKAAHPLLAGPVELIRGGGVAGRTKLDFVAVGERVSIGFGPDPDIVVTREIESIKDESSLLGSWQTKTHDVQIKLSNLGRTKKKVTVEERVLVSEIEKVVVRVVPEKSTGNVTPDENGFLKWAFELPTGGRQAVVLRVQIKRHADVIG